MPRYCRRVLPQSRSQTRPGYLRRVAIRVTAMSAVALPLAFGFGYLIGGAWLGLRAFFTVAGFMAVSWGTVVIRFRRLPH